MSALKERARDLGLWSICENWDDYANATWLPSFLHEEEEIRKRRAFERNRSAAKLGQFRPMSEFDWSWPTRADREQIEDLFTLDFIKDKSNVILLGTNGLGKTMIAKNLAFHAVTSGIATRFVKASDMLADLVDADGARERRSRLNRYCSAHLLVIDEVGYLSYDNRFADLLYEVVSGRYERHSTIVTTNKPFSEWKDIFPHAACAVTLVDRLLHKAETVLIEGESFRVKESTERVTARTKARKSGKKKT